MANSDLLFIQSQAQNPETHIIDQLRIIAVLLREGFGLPDEDSSLTKQPNPTIIS